MNQQLEALKSSSTCLTFFWFDLNKFKYINDTFGHTAGDQVLIEVAKRLKSLLPSTRTPFRIGGDEFAVVVRSVDKHLYEDTLSLIE